MIHLTDVIRVYPTAGGSVRALDGVSLDVEPGEFLAVRGPSGCGKSTLLTIVGGLAKPSSGQVTVDGHDLVRMSSAERARLRAERIGFVFQTFPLLPYLDVTQNVLAAALPARRSEAAQRADELLDAFQLGHRLRHRPAQLSTGECQRVAIARALVNRPGLILADEPTGNLDPENASGVMDILCEFHSSGGTILLVTHEDHVAKLASRTIGIREGRVGP